MHDAKILWKLNRLMWECPKERWSKLYRLKNRNSTILNYFREYRKLYFKCYISMAEVHVGSNFLPCYSVIGQKILWKPLLEAIITLTHFMPLDPFFNPWKHQKTRGFRGYIKGPVTRFNFRIIVDLPIFSPFLWNAAI